MRFLLMAALLGLVLGAPAQAQTTPNIACTHAGNNSAAFTRSNECDDKLDNAMNSALAIATGDANVTLTAAQQNEEGLLEFTGALTADRDVTLLAGQERRLTGCNNTTGAFDLVFKYATGATVSVRSGEIVDIHADGTDVLRRGLPDVPGIGTISTFDGTNDKFLVWDNDVNAYRAVTADDMPGSGVAGGGTAVTAGAWELIEEKPASASANIDLLFDDTLYDEVRVSFFDVIGATDAQGINVRVSTDGGSTFLSTSTYSWSMNQQTEGPQTTYSDATFGSTGLNAELEIAPAALSSAATEAASGEVRLKSPGSSNIKPMYSIVSAVDSSSNSRRFVGAGYNTTTSPIDALRFRMSSGNISAGTFQLWGLRKDATTVAYVQTTDATATTLHSQAVAAETAVSVTVVVQAREAATGDVRHETLTALIKNEAGTTSQVGTTQSLHTAIADAGASWTITLEDDPTPDEWRIRVTGEASHTIDWTAKIESIIQTD
jgi:hypothetical protein